MTKKIKNNKESSRVKKHKNNKVMNIISVFFIILTILVLYKPVKLILTAEYVPAQIVACVGKVSKKIANGRRIRHSYAPKALTENGETATGTLALSKKSWCKNMIGNSTHVFIDNNEPKNNRISSFLQLWMFPVYLVFITAILITRNRKIVMLPISLVFVGITLYLLNQEFGFITSQKQNGLEGVSKIALTECINKNMKINKLKNRSEITSLGCQASGIIDLSALADLENLEKLYLQNNSFLSLESMPRLNKLKVISVAGNKELTSLRGIDNLPQLVELQANLSAINDLSGVESLKELRIAAFMGNQISDVSAFTHLSKIEDVHFHKNSISNIEAFSNKPELKRFSAMYNKISNISPLFGNKKLNMVYVKGNKKISCSQLSSLKKLLSPDANVSGDKCN